MNVGIWGESEACRYLEQGGYRIVERNFRCKMGEVDIIAEREETIYFFEVKTRRSLVCGVPAEAIDARKRRHIQRTIQYYLISHYIIDMDIQVDVIEVLICNGKAYLRHTENAFA